MRIQQRQRGFLILMAAILIALGALLAVVGTFLNVTRSESAGGHLGSTQALMIAQAGIERAVYEYRRGTACNGLSAVNADLGNGNFAVTASLYNTTAATVFTGGVSATASTIPVDSVAAYASHGRIRIDNEEINYTGTSTDATRCSPASACFTGAIRGVNPSTAAAHAAGAGVYQNQCLIRSVGVATNTSGQRILEANVPGWGGSAFFDGSSILYTATLSSIGGVTNTNFPAGTNLVIAVVSIRSGQGGVRTVTAGNLELRRGNATVVAENLSNILYANGGTPDSNTFLNETQFFLYRDTAAAANQSYSIWIAQSSNPFNNAMGEVKMLVINNPPLSDFVAGTNMNNIGTTLTSIQTLNTTLPAGDYVVLAAVELDNRVNATSAINAGNLRLRASGVTIASNEGRIDLDDNSGEANRGTGFLLMAKVSNVAANMSYDVAAQAVATGPIGAARIMVIGGLKSAFVDSGAVTLSTTGTTVSTLLTDFPAGENVVIAATQYVNALGNDSDVVEGGERIIFNGGALAVNQSSYRMCQSNVNCDDFAAGLLARQGNASPNVSFAVTVSTSDVTVFGETKLMALHIEQDLIDWVEIFQ
jgi:hypothetical protein